MASSGSSQLAALCAVTSFIWLSQNVENHQLIEQPQLSSFLCLLISGIAAFLASFFSLWLPGANGRFDDDLGLLRSPKASLPRKPRRYFLPSLVLCIILRLEIFHHVSSNLQCSNPGVEAWLPFAILLYELLPGRAPRGTSAEQLSDDIGDTIFDALGQWLNGLRIPLIAGILSLSYGIYLASSQSVRSNFICSGREGTAFVVLLQWGGLFLDAAIIVMLWRLLAWARTTKSRLKTLSSILLASAAGSGLSYFSSRMFEHARPMSHHFRGLDSLYIFDVVVDGLAFSVFLISAGLLTTEGSPLSLIGIMTFVAGLLSAIRRVRLMGSWENISTTTSYLVFMLICNGFAFFVYANNLRSVVFVHRAFVVFFLILITIIATVYSLVRGQQIFDNHPIERLIYDNRVEAGRWLIHASVSNSLPVAVQEYKERHRGRDPPPKFDVWYQFAKDRQSPIIDHFAQMEGDLLPFWGIAPGKIRDDVHRAATEPDIYLVVIQNGTLGYSDSVSASHKLILDDLADMAKTFGHHLPDGLEFAINLNDRPRVIAPWEDVKRFSLAGNQKGLGKLLSKRSTSTANDAAAGAPGNMITARTFREMTALTCPTGTQTRSGVHWDIQSFCSWCAQPQSQGQYLTNWPMSQELCHQSDLLRLHGFHTATPSPQPLQELLPVFSRAKTDSYSDILLPLLHQGGVVDGDQDTFGTKRKQLFWRGRLDGDLNKELLLGGHQSRFVHLTQNASSTEETTILLPVSHNPGRFAYEHVLTAELNSFLTINAGFIDPSNVCGNDCAARGEFGVLSDVDEKSLVSQSLLYQYVLVMDTNDGPSRSLLPVLRSGSIPFVASIFKEWYSERLLPWVHFVPIDLRFHALHGTLAYFMGINQDGKGRVNGRDVRMDFKRDNGKWVAEEGRRFASKAIRREDMEVYLFRLLLEWARLVDDNRDKMGFTT